MFRDYLQMISEGVKLNSQQAYHALQLMIEDDVNDVFMSSFITTFLHRMPSVDELRGFRQVMLDRCHIPLVNHNHAIDIVGTGGDGKDTFNISTCASVVVSAAGYPVIKHGNYSSSSVSGSSNVLETLGYRFMNDAASIQEAIDEVGFVFLHAPIFHPAMKKVSPIRKAMGFRTFFNLLGPLMNPLQPTFLVTGTSSLSIARLYHYFLQEENIKYYVLYDMGGYDEVTLLDNVKVFGNRYETILDEHAFGMKNESSSTLYGGDSIESSARVFMDVLNNYACDNKINTVAANAALAIHLVDQTRSLRDISSECVEIIKSGKAATHFSKIINQSSR